MSFIPDNMGVLRGAAYLKKLNRQVQNKLQPSQTPPEPAAKVISASKSVLSSGNNTTLSGALNFALTMNESSVRDSPSMLKVQQNFKEEERPQFIDHEQTKRDENTQGLGNRTAQISNSSDEETKRLYGLQSSEAADSSFTSSSIEPTQQDAIDLRGAIIQKVKFEIAMDPNLSEDDIKSYIDEEFGIGTSELLDIQRVDNGAGKSSVIVKQVEYDSLDVADKSVFLQAVSNMKQNYDTQGSERSLTGADIEKVIDEIKSTLGNEGLPFVEQLREDLKNSTDVEVTLSQFEADALDLGLSSSDSEKIKSLVEILKSADQRTLQGFDENAIIDDAKIQYSSGRYAEAFSPEEIDAQASLTENLLFLNR